MESITQFFSSMTLRGVAIGVGIFLVTFFANLALVSFILVKIPADYFRESQGKFLAKQSPVVRVLASDWQKYCGSDSGCPRCFTFIAGSARARCVNNFARRHVARLSRPSAF